MVSRRSAAWLTLVGLAACATFAASCGSPQIDLTKALEVTDVKTGFFDAGVVEGNKNKLVPSISFRLKNGGEEIAGAVQVNAVFRRVGEGEEWGSAYLPRITADDLPTGATTEPIVLRSPQGYTGTETRSEMLQSRYFVDVQVQLFAKYGSSQWARLGDYKIERVVLTQ